MLRIAYVSLLVVTVFASPCGVVRAGAIDSSVVQIRLPGEDATFIYLEAPGGFTARLETENSSVEARKIFLGDGEVAVELRIDPVKGPVFQGEEIKSGHVFKKDATIKLHPGYKRASDLRPGSVYVILPGVTFDAAKPKALTLEDFLK